MRLKKTLSALLILLIGCGPSEAEVVCEKNNGEWVSQFSHYNYVWISNGKGGGYNIMQPVFTYHCIQKVE